MNDVIENDFRSSWIAMHEFFTDLVENYDGSQHVRPMLGLIAKFQSCGYDARFRAGQSLHYLMISRSAKHGLDENDPSISFYSAGNEQFNLRYWESKRQLVEYDFELSDFEPTEDSSVQKLLDYQIP